MQNRVPFEQLYREHHQMVYNLSLHYLQNVEDAEEITQDVFVKLHHSIDKFENRSTVKTWIYRITVNACLDLIKRKNSKRHFFSFGKGRVEKENFEVAHFEHPGILLENQEQAKILFDVINSLPQSQKTALILSKLDGLSNPEIAAIMQVSISSVESLVFRSKAALRDKLSEKLETYRKK